MADQNRFTTREHGTQIRIFDSGLLVKVVDSENEVQQWTSKMETNPRRAVGFWQSAPDDDLPHPSEFVDSSWDENERLRVAEALRALNFPGLVTHTFRGRSRCRICGEPNGASEHFTDEYTWPDGYAHYIGSHGVKPTDEFINWILRGGSDDS